MTKEKVVSELIDWLKAFLFALVVVLVISRFVVIAQIDGTSMEPTLHDGDHVITARHFTSIDYNDIIGFNFTLDDGSEEYHVKRVVGMPGDTVVVDGVQVLVNGEVVIEDGVASYPKQSYELDDNQYFVVGDNYQVSYDSRLHGPISGDEILGEIVIELPF